MDSTGYSTNKYESWFNVRTGEESKRREFKKSHMIVGYWYKGILSHEVTLGHHHDSPVFPILMGKLPSGDYDNMRVIQGTAAGITVIWFQRKA